jgi:hypothetical protein
VDTLVNKWALILDRPGPTASGAVPTLADLAVIAEVVEAQVNADYVPECGGQVCSIRASDGSDLEPDEKRFIFTAVLPDAPGASAYHVPGAAYCAVSTCADLFGPSGLGVDASHEILEDAGNPGCNAAADDGRGLLHELEECDAVEMQTYAIVHPTAGSVHVSNFLLPSWRTPGASGPYTFMGKKGITGYVEPSGPFQTAASPGGSGNYQIVFPSTATQESQVFGRKPALPPLPKTVTNSAATLRGHPKKPAKFFHWTSRAQRAVRAHNDHVRALTEARSAPPTTDLG